MLADIQSQVNWLKRQERLIKNPIYKKQLKNRADYLATLSIIPITEINLDDIEFVYERDLS